MFLVGRNRGKGNAVELLKNYDGVRVTDFYPGYKNIDGDQAGCWAHIIRKPRDLKDNKNLSSEKFNKIARLDKDCYRN